MADIKRLNYFNSQFLVDKDFIDEQAYQVGMRRRLNSALHTWGIADGGFLVTGVGAKVLSISSGIAIDNAGQEIVLLGPAAVDLSDTAKFPQGSDVYVAVKYQDVFDAADHYTAGGVDNYTRTTERPQVQATLAAPPNDGSVIQLAKVHLDANGNVATIDMTVQTAASSKINPTSTLQVGRLTVNGNASVGGNLGVGTASPQRNLSVNSALNIDQADSNDSGINPGLTFGSNSGEGISSKRTTGGNQRGLDLYTAAITRLSITNSGQVGFGTTTPDRSLTIANSSGANYMNVKDGTHEILMGVDGAGGIVSVMTNHDLVLRAGGNSEKMRITASGNVGIGTSTPQYPLDVKASIIKLGLESNGGGQLIIANNPNDNQVYLEAWNSTGNGNAAILSLTGFQAQPVPAINLVSGSVTATGDLHVQGGVRVDNSDIYFTRTDHAHTGFGNNIGFAAIENSVNYGGLMILGRTITNNPLMRVVKLWDYLAVNGNLDVTGNAAKPGGGSWATLSDIALKKNVQPLTGALDKLLQLQGVTFEWKEPEKQGNLTGTQIGMVAQEVEKAFPEWVGASIDGSKTVTFRGFEALTVEALRELKSRLDFMQQQLDELARQTPASSPATRATETPESKQGHANVDSEKKSADASAR